MLHDRISELKRKEAKASRAELLDLASLLSLAASRFEGTRDRRASLPYLEAAEEIYRRLGVKDEQADVAGRTGLVLLRAGEFPSAIQALDRTCRLHHESGTRKAEANALGNLGTCYQTLGDLPKAIGYHEQALKIHREIGHREGEANALGNLGAIFNQMGRYDGALACWLLALPIFSEIRSPTAARVREWIAHLEERTRLKFWWWRRLSQARSNARQVGDAALKHLGGGGRPSQPGLG